MSTSSNATVRSFLDDELSVAEFEQRLYQDPELEAALSSVPAPPRCDPPSDSLYLYLISLDFQSPDDIRSAKRALAQFASSTDEQVSSGALWASDFDEPNPPVTDKLIARVEALLNVKLPAAYVTLMREQNGGYLHPNEVAFVEPPPASMDYYTGDGTVTLGGIFGLNHDPDATGGIAKTLPMSEEWEIPQGLILLDGDGHTWVALDYRKEKVDPPVVYYVSESGEHATIARNFAAFLKALQILDEP